MKVNQLHLVTDKEFLLKLMIQTKKKLTLIKL